LQPGALLNYPLMDEAGPTVLEHGQSGGPETSPDFELFRTITKLNT